MDLLQQTIGSFKVRQHLHTGVNGALYSAIDPMTGQKVAVKVMHRHLTAEDERAAAFEDHVRRVGFLDTPGVVRVLSTARLPDDTLCVISEFMLSPTLADLFHDSEEPLETAQTLDLLCGLALVLAAVHGHGFVHGNLKPENVFLVPQQDGSWPPQVRIADFGVTHLLRPETATVEAAKASPLAGCPYYLSPEQCRGERAGPQSDIYAMGVIAYQLLTGRLPYSSPRPADVLDKHLEGALRPPSEITALDPALEAVLLKALSTEAKDRYETVIAFRNALMEINQGKGPEAVAISAESEPPEPEPAKPAESPEPVPAGRAAQSDRQATNRRANTPLPVAPSGRLPAIKASSASARSTPQSTSRSQPGSQTTAPLAKRQSHVTEEVKRRGNLAAWLALWIIVVGGSVVGVYRGVGGHWPWQENVGTRGRGLLEINTIPEGATVYLNSREWDRKTPVRIAVQRRLTYQLMFHKRGFLGVSRKVALGADEERRFIEIKLVPKIRWGTLQINTSHKANIFLDSRRVGFETTEVNLAEVRADVGHELRIVAPGFKTVRRNIHITQGKVSVLKFELVRVDAPPSAH